MPMTSNSSATSYVDATTLFNFYDIRTIADLISDVGTRTGGSPNPTPATVAASAKLQAALDSAAGLIEAACLRGSRYSAADLNALTGVSQQLLFELNADLAMGGLWKRRPDKGPVPPAYMQALEILKALADGERIFSFVEVEQADLPLAVVMGPTDVEDQGFLVVQAQRYFGQRGDQSPPIPPAHP